VAKVLQHIRARRREGRERGAILVEAAVIFPLLIFLVLGIVEYALAYRNSLTVSSSTRAGARTASALARNAEFADDAVDSVATALTAMPKDRWQEVWVYKADGATGLPVGSTDFSSCTTCVRYAWDGTAWTPVQETWTYSNQNACPGEAEYVGVYVKARHEYVTKLFGAGRTLSEHTVMRFEPLPRSSCK
jgi:Flp pilus assembly protein TadG